MRGSPPPLSSVFLRVFLPDGDCNHQQLNASDRHVSNSRHRALNDPAVLQRRNEAIAKVQPLPVAQYPIDPLPLQLEAARALKPRKRSYDNRGAVSFAGQQAAAGFDMQAALSDPRNARACRHFFLTPGGAGCSRGSNCRFSHALET